MSENEQNWFNSLLSATYTVNLETIQLKNVPVKVVHVYDSDTFHVVLFRNGCLQKFVVRLLGIDGPEMRPKKGSQTYELEKMAAIKARNRLVQLCVEPRLSSQITPLTSTKEIQCLLENSKHLMCLTVNTKDKYGRLLGKLNQFDTRVDPFNLFCQSIATNTNELGGDMKDENHAGKSISEIMIEEGMTRPYFGGTRQPWRTDELLLLINKKIDSFTDN